MPGTGTQVCDAVVVGDMDSKQSWNMHVPLEVETSTAALPYSQQAPITEVERV